MISILQAKFPFFLPDLPYSSDSFGTIYSKESFEYHHGKHHNAYVTKLNELAKGTEYEKLTLLEIIKKSFVEKNDPIFNNAAQVYNHDFFWHSISPQGGSKPSEKLKITSLINESFGDFEKFCDHFKNTGISQFGSGWVWLVLNKTTKKLEIVKTANAHTPLVDSNLIPILTADVWEHAYYIDYRNKRPDFLATFLAKMVNWDFAEKNL